MWRSKGPKPFSLRQFVMLLLLVVVSSKVLQLQDLQDLQVLPDGEYRFLRFDQLLGQLSNLPNGNHLDAAQMIDLDNQFMKSKYLSNVTNNVFTMKDIHGMLHIVSSKGSGELNSVVSSIVNLKLVAKLQFKALDSIYSGCYKLDEVVGNGMNLTAIPDFSHFSTLSDIKKPFTPYCMETTDRTYENCGPEQCRFYMHCVLHQRVCTSQLVDVASMLVLEQQNIPFLTDDAEVDAAIVKCMVLAQFGDTVMALRFIEAMINEHGDQVGFLQSRALALIRSGLSDQKTIDAIVRDVNSALSIATTNEECLYRKAAVLLALAHFFEAMQVIEIATSLYPDNPEFYDMKAACNFQFQDLAQAEANFRKALELGVANDQETLMKLGLVLYRQGKLANAVTVYKDLTRLVPGDINAILSVAHTYRQLGDGKKALNYANKAHKISGNGKVVLLYRGGLYHYLGKDRTALLDLKICLAHHPDHDLCLYNAGLAYASLGNFYQAVLQLSKVANGVDMNQAKLLTNSHYVKSLHLLNYFRYLYWKLDSKPNELTLDKDLKPGFRDAWAKVVLPTADEFVHTEQRGISPGMRPVEEMRFGDYPPRVRDLICRARKYGKHMQVRADSFLPNERFNLAMGLAAIHIGQKLNSAWMSEKKADRNRLTWKRVFEIALPYRRMADLETPVLWLSSIFDLGYHNEVSFYRGQVKNHRMKSYFELVFDLTRSMIKDQLTMHQADRAAEVHDAITPEQLANLAKDQIPTQITTSVTSTVKPGHKFEGGMIVLTNTAFGAALYMNIPTTQTKTRDYNQELSTLMSRLSSIAAKLHPNSTKSFDVGKAEHIMMTIAYYFFNLCPFSRGSASVGFATLFGMFLSINEEITSPLPAGKMLDMEAALCGGADVFIIGTKHWFKISPLEEPITSMALVEETFPTVRSLLEVLSLEEFDC